MAFPSLKMHHSYVAMPALHQLSVGREQVLGEGAGYPR